MAHRAGLLTRSCSSRMSSTQVMVFPSEGDRDSRIMSTPSSPALLHRMDVPSSRYPHTVSRFTPYPGCLAVICILSVPSLAAVSTLSSRYSMVSLRSFSMDEVRLYGYASISGVNMDISTPYCFFQPRIACISSLPMSWA